MKTPRGIHSQTQRLAQILKTHPRYLKEIWERMESPGSGKLDLAHAIHKYFVLRGEEVQGVQFERLAGEFLEAFKVSQRLKRKDSEMKGASLWIPKPGTRQGPCDSPCQHSRCQVLRKEAQSLCPECEKPIGYQTPYRLRSPDMALVHILCLKRGSDRS